MNELRIKVIKNTPPMTVKVSFKGLFTAFLLSDSLHLSFSTYPPGRINNYCCKNKTFLCNIIAIPSLTKLFCYNLLIRVY